MSLEAAVCLINRMNANYTGEMKLQASKLWSDAAPDSMRCRLPTHNFHTRVIFRWKTYKFSNLTHWMSVFLYSVKKECFAPHPQLGQGKIEDEVLQVSDYVKTRSWHSIIVLFSGIFVLVRSWERVKGSGVFANAVGYSREISQKICHFGRFRC